MPFVMQPEAAAVPVQAVAQVKASSIYRERERDSDRAVMKTPLPLLLLLLLLKGGWTDCLKVNSFITLHRLSISESCVWHSNEKLPNKYMKLWEKILINYCLINFMGIITSVLGNRQDIYKQLCKVKVDKSLELKNKYAISWLFTCLWEKAGVSIILFCLNLCSL